MMYAMMYAPVILENAFDNFFEYSTTTFVYDSRDNNAIHRTLVRPRCFLNWHFRLCFYIPNQIFPNCGLRTPLGVRQLVFKHQNSQYQSQHYMCNIVIYIFKCKLSSHVIEITGYY